MATDYDAPRKTDDDSESIEALKERVPDKMSGTVDVEDADNPAGFELPGADLSDLELDVVVLPAQADEFTCVECFLVKHRSQLAEERSGTARWKRAVLLDKLQFDVFAWYYRKIRPDFATFFLNSNQRRRILGCSSIALF